MTYDRAHMHKRKSNEVAPPPIAEVLRNLYEEAIEQRRRVG